MGDKTFVHVNRLKRTSCQRFFVLKNLKLIYTFSRKVTVFILFRCGNRILNCNLLEHTEHRPNTMCRNFIDFPYV